MAVELSEVDSSSVIAGGVTTANFPQAAMNLRRSLSASVELLCVMVMPRTVQNTNERTRRIRVDPNANKTRRNRHGSRKFGRTEIRGFRGEEFKPACHVCGEPFFGASLPIRHGKSS